MKYNKHFAQVLKIKTHYLSLGSAKNTLVFLHGWGASTDSFLELARDIHKRSGLSVVLLDWPNFGASGDTPDTGWSSADYAKFLVEFCKSELKNKNLYFYAHSFGGKVLCNALFKHSDLAQKIVLSGSAGVVLPFTLRQRVASCCSKVFGFTKHILPSKITKKIGAKLSGSYAHLDAKPNQTATLQKVLAEPDFRDKLPKIKTETLLLWGKNDTYTPLKAGQIFANKLPNNTFHLFSDGRHGLHYTHKNIITNLVTEFLS